jgi:hypothetical protein
MLNDTGVKDTSHAFGLLFLGVSFAVGLGAILTELILIRKMSTIYYALIWSGSFGLTFGIIFFRYRKSILYVRNRMRKSMVWPATAKAINGLCWAGPFIAIPIFMHFYQFLILLGIGLGNTSTYLLMRKYNKLDNREQMIVGSISLLAIPVAIGFDSILFAARQDIALMTSRVLIAVAYAVGGIYAISSKN